MRGKRQGEGKRPPRIASVTLGAMLRMPPQVTGMARLASWLLGSWITFASYDKPFLGGSRMQVQPTYLLPTLLLCNRQPPTANRATSMSRRKVRGQNDSASRTKVRTTDTYNGVSANCYGLCSSSPGRSGLRGDKYSLGSHSPQATKASLLS